MEFGPFVLLSLFYAVIGLGVVRQLVGNWRATFDRRFTEADRALVDQSAFFILLPIAVALHELGHAVAIWSFGGEVVDFGYFVFAGYVSYREPFSDVQRILVALAGNLVNVVLAAAAVAVVFLRRPPLRAAFNELLLQFAFLSILNALVFYPLLDVVSGLNGDWSQIYFGGVPALSAAIFVVHVGILLLAVWAWRDEGMRARVAALTGMPRGFERRPLGGIRRGTPAARPWPGHDEAVSSDERALREAGERVASGWPTRVNVALQTQASGPVLVLAWSAGGHPRSVIARVAAGSLELWGIAGSANLRPEPARRLLRRLPSVPDADALTLELRLAMEAVQEWQPMGTRPAS